MSYHEDQHEHAIKLRDELFRDPGDDIELSKPELNLWTGVREDALEYYRKIKKSDGGQAISQRGTCFLLK